MRIIQTAERPCFPRACEYHAVVGAVPAQIDRAYSAYARGCYAVSAEEFRDFGDVFFGHRSRDPDSLGNRAVAASDCAYDFGAADFDCPEKLAIFHAGISPDDDLTVSAFCAGGSVDRIADRSGQTDLSDHIFFGEE